MILCSFSYYYRFPFSFGRTYFGFSDLAASILLSADLSRVPDTTDKEPTETTGKAVDTKDVSDEDDQQEDVENVLSDDEEPKETEKDFEDTKTDSEGDPSHDRHGSDNEVSSDKQQPNETDEETEDDADEADDKERHVKPLKKVDKKSASHSVDTDLSDDEPLVLNSATI